MEKLAPKVTLALRTLGALQALAGAAAFTAIFLFAGQELLDLFGEEIMMDGRIIRNIAFLMMLLVFASGALSWVRLRWGWVFSFSVATFFLVMALLMGPGTISATKWSFLGLMALNLLNWAVAVVYYFQDLYT